ncbi:MAG: hypothetical protein RL411_947 [Bacteroidota bacterium]
MLLLFRSLARIIPDLYCFKAAELRNTEYSLTDLNHRLLPCKGSTLAAELRERTLNSLSSADRSRTYTKLVLNQPPLPLGYHAILVGMVGIEPTRSIDRQILSLLRLPVPPQSQTAPLGFEPRKRGSKPPVIPFHHRATKIT